MAREIPLTRGQVAIVDDEDYEYLAQFKWQAHWDRHTRSFRANRCVKGPGIGRHAKLKQYTVWMHREILGLKRGDPRKGDHIIPGATLDNRRSNLRIATNTQNLRNSTKHKNNKSGFLGVSFAKRRNKFIAQITINGKRTCVGASKDPEKAYAFYCAAAAKHYGEFAPYVTRRGIEHVEADADGK